MEVDVEGETETECECPKCGHKFKTNVHYVDTVEIDMSDYAPDYDWRD